jgi:ABC-type bacteriocin/lantibiotic exporter with double-glycine peptidase domain
MESQVLRPIQRLWRLLKPDKKEITNVYVYSAFNGLVNLSLPLGIQAIINLIQGGQISTSWIVLVVLVVLGVALAGVMRIMQLRITENLQQKIFARGAFEFAYRIPKIKLEALYNQYAPELMNRFFDIFSVQKGLSKLLIDFSSASLQVIFGLILLSLYHPLFILFSIILIILLYLIFVLTAKKGLETSLEESKYKYQLAHWLEEIARSVISFKLSGETDLPSKKADIHVMKYLKARDKHFNILVIQYSLMVVFKVLVAAGLLILGGILVMQQVINIGQFVAAEIIILLVITSVEKLVMSLENIYDVITAIEKLGQVMDIELDKEEGIKINEENLSKGLKVDLKNIHFSYPPHIKQTLSNIHLQVEACSSVLILGPNGSGKTTLMHLIAGLYDSQEGIVSYNDLPKGNINITSLRSVIGDCMTRGELFEGSILENITMGRKEATFENAKWAVENLGLKDFIKTQSKGYDTIVDPQGKRFPLSIVEKILLARSIADKPKLLLLEDAFEHIDGIDKNNIIDFLIDKKNPWTIIAISNDPYLATKVDKIIRMDRGKIIEEIIVNPTK